MSAWHPGEHGTTYGGNAVACAAAVAVIETMRAERIPERAAALGRRVMQRIEGGPSASPQSATCAGSG